MGNLIERNICSDWIMNRVLTKFGRLKIDNGGDRQAIMSVIQIGGFQMTNVPNLSVTNLTRQFGPQNP